ncbi:MAG TPA: RluA family pseudouridine synthase [Crocinitomix sp.]|nr:RluA family pseudouridine synthase [Crocinitomix sp.]
MNNFSINVIYEDNHLIVVNKKSGDIVQGDKTGDLPLSDEVKTYIKAKYNKPGKVYLGTVHRLDRPTSGIVLFAKTSKALSRMNKKFKDKDIQKTYWAVVEKPKNINKFPLQNTLIDFLKKNEKQNKSYCFKQEINGAKKSELSYKVIGKGDNYWFVEIKPKTGRHHQIRVQLSNIGLIIKGDLKYGAKRSNKDGSIHLLARQLDFIHPVKKQPITIKANPPKDTLWDEFLKQSEKKERS